MQLPLILLVAVLLGSTAFGDPPDGAKAFLAVPNAVWSWNPNQQDMDPGDLPEQLRKLAATTLASGDQAPDRFSGYAIDLNNDKSPEFFLRSQFGGSGGPHYFIFSSRRGEWTTIGSFQGGFHVLGPENGWNTIIGFSGGGGDSLAMFRLDFRGDAYDQIWLAHFDAGQIIPPQSLFPHRLWCDDARSPEERLERLEGFWRVYLPLCDGGSNPDRPEYEDATHVSHIRGAAFELALAYTTAGRKEEARKIIRWLRWSDQLELWSDQPNPLKSTATPESADTGPSQVPQQ